MLVSAVHCWNAFTPMVLTVAGMLVTAVRALLLMNAWVPMLVSLMLSALKDTVARLVQLANAYIPICSTSVPIEILVSLE